MVFSTGAKITANIVEEIANGLIATPGGYWTNITITDPGATMWNTSDKSGNNAKRALKFDNLIENPMFLALEVINTSTNFYGGFYGKGIRVVISPSWSNPTHSYPSSGIQTTFVPFESRSTTVSADLATALTTYFLWYENNGFVIMGKPEPNSTDNYQQSFIIVVERSNTKRYIDIYTNFFVYTVANMYAPLYGSGYDTLWRHRLILRPFAYQYPDTPVADWAPVSPGISNGYGISFLPLPSYYAYKSSGNGKVYYIKPIIHNQTNSKTPIFQSELFFMWSEGTGLIDGDIVAIQGQITKYICKALDSPDSTNRLTFAIKYVG